MRNIAGAIWKYVATLAVACMVAGLLLYSAMDVSKQNANEYKVQRAADAGVSMAQFDLLCPFGYVAERCIDIRRADVDGDGKQDVVSLVFDSSLSTGMCQTIVLFATGEQATEKFYFNEENRLASAAEAHFSLVGFADIDGHPGQEIFARIVVDGRWSFSGVQYRGSNTIGKIVFRGESIPDGPDSAYVALKNASNQEGKIVANGLACQKLDPALADAFTVWFVVRFSDGAFTVLTVFYRSDGRSYELREDLEDTYQNTVGAKDAGTMQSVIDQLASQTCPGFK